MMSPNADYRTLIQVGWILSDELAAEHGIDRTSTDYIFTLEMAEADGGVRPEYADRLVPIYRLSPNYETGVWHLLTPSPSWDAKQHCSCGAEFASRCQFWKHQADAYVALSPNDGSRS